MHSIITFNIDELSFVGHKIETFEFTISNWKNKSKYLHYAVQNVYFQTTIYKL